MIKLGSSADGWWPSLSTKLTQPDLGSRHPSKHMPLLLLRLKDYPSNHTAPWDPSPVNEGVRHAMGPEQVLRTMEEIISSLTISGCLALVDN